MKRAVLLIAALLAVGTMARAQSPQDQRMAFGGGSHFEFVIPVNALGHVWAEVTWSPAVPMRAYLFSPGHPHPIAQADGSGRLTVSSRVVHWKAGETWMLRLASPNLAANVRGDLRVVWPSGNRPGVAVLWRNAGPTDAVVLAQATARIRAVRANMPAPEMITSADGGGTLRAWDRAAYGDFLDVVQARIDVLSTTPARLVQNDATVLGGVAAPAARIASGSVVTAGFTGLRVASDSRYHVDHESDAPYVVTALVREDGGRVVTGRTPVMSMLRPGDVEQVAGGVQELARSGAAPTHIAVAVFERENGNPDEAMAQFLRAVELFTVYRAQQGTTPADADFPWFVGLAAEASGEEIIGTPQLLAVTADGVIDGTGKATPWRPDANGGRRATPSISFNGGGAQMQVAINVVTDRR